AYCYAPATTDIYSLSLHDALPISHKFSLKEDIEIAGFLVATIAWGNRKSIINNGHRLIEIMGNSPFDFVMDFSKKNSESLSPFRSEEHTSELQSRENLVCRLLLEK